MPEKKLKCSECGKEIGPGTGCDVYKHTISCFHLPDIGKEQLQKLYEGDSSEYARRIIANLAGKEV